MSGPRPPDEAPRAEPEHAPRAPGPGSRAALAVLAFGGLGLLPVAPGTWGTCGAAALAAVFVARPAFLAPLGDWTTFAAGAALVASALTLLLVPAIERTHGKDPGVVVTDEVAGYFATLLAVPHPTPADLVAAFFVFRLLDVVKPWPARALERLPSGWGVLLDDLAAAGWGAALLALTHTVARASLR